MSCGILNRWGSITYCGSFWKRDGIWANNRTTRRNHWIFVFARFWVFADLYVGRCGVLSVGMKSLRWFGE